MAGERVTLEVAERTKLGSSESRRLRKQGLVPGVLYGRVEPVAILVGERELRTALTTPAGSHVVLENLRLTVWARAMVDHHPGNDPLAGYTRHVEDHWQVAMAHGHYFGEH